MTSNKRAPSESARTGGPRRARRRRRRTTGCVGRAARPAVRGSRVRARRSSSRHPPGLSRSHPRPRQDACPDRGDRRRDRPAAARRCSSRARARPRSTPCAPRARTRRITPMRRIITFRQQDVAPGKGTIVVAAAGTSDLPVAEEAALHGRADGQRRRARCTTSASPGSTGCSASARASPPRASSSSSPGMEGALPSVVAGLVSVPVIAVPTSVGYGASFGGIAALLGMLNSCASGVSVVNIDNGFGAANIASLDQSLVGLRAEARGWRPAQYSALNCARISGSPPCPTRSLLQRSHLCSLEPCGPSNSIASSRPSAASR